MCTCNCSFRKYALTGRGIGLKIVTLVSLLIGLIVGICGPIIMRNALNETGALNEFINTLPIVTIENGKIVNPVYNNETWYIPGTVEGSSDIKIIANTTVDSIDAIPADVGLYITARNIYTTDAVFPLPTTLSTVITHDTVRRYFDMMLRLSGVVLGSIIFVLGIIGFLIIYIPVFIIGFIMNRQLTIDAWGRILAWPWSIFYGITVLLSSFTMIAISPLYGSLIPMLITWIIGVMLANSSDEETCSLQSINTDESMISQNESTETTVEFEEIPAETTAPETTIPTATVPIVRRKTVNIKPKNVPTTKKGKNKKKK